MQQKLQVLGADVQKGTSRKTGQAYEIPFAECVVHGPDGSIFVGRLNLPKGQELPKPGFYTAQMGLARNGMDGQIVGRVEKLIPLKPGV